MFRFGLRMSLRGGREAATRLALTTLAVAIGVALLLCALADFHAFQVSSNRSCWECTGTGTPGGPPGASTPGASTPGASTPGAPQPTPHAELWNYTADYYQ